MKIKISSKTAFSLVEMLIALILISLLIGLAVFSFKHQLLIIQKTKKTGINKVLVYNQLRSSIQSMKYYVVDDYDILNNQMKNLHFYFSGTKTEMNYITISPLFSDDIAVVELLCNGNELVYKEEPLYDNIDFLRPHVLEESREISIYKNLDKCEFEYFYGENKFEILNNIVPTTVVLNIISQDIYDPLYINVKSDYNTSLGIIKDALYPVQ